MKLSTRGKYGLYAMFYLATQAGNGPQPLKSIAETGVPEQYLEQLLGSLRRAGLVTTVRGVQGGYQLARDPAEITVGDIIDATEGPVSLSECLHDSEACRKSCDCPTRMVWSRLTDRINDLLQSITLKDMLGKES
jgi:Rrf2 family transcriptional regulator, cysteine metabolism repressor